MVSLGAQKLYPPGKNKLLPEYPLKKRLGVPHNQYGHFVKKTFCPCRDSNPGTSSMKLSSYAIKGKGKGKQSRYRPEVVQRVPGSLGSQIS
jgi:hypothetical protein